MHGGPARTCMVHIRVNLLMARLCWIRVTLRIESSPVGHEANGYGPVTKQIYNIIIILKFPEVPGTCCDQLP